MYKLCKNIIIIKKKEEYLLIHFGKLVYKFS